VINRLLASSSKSRFLCKYKHVKVAYDSAMIDRYRCVKPYYFLFIYFLCPFFFFCMVKLLYALRSKMDTKKLSYSTRNAPNDQPLI